LFQGLYRNWDSFLTNHYWYWSPWPRRGQIFVENATKSTHDPEWVAYNYSNWCVRTQISAD